MSFETPGYLSLLLIVPFLVYLRHFWPKRGGRVTFSFGTWGGAGFHYRSAFITLLRGTSAVLFWSAMVLLIVALAGPVSTLKHRVFLTRGVDIMFVLDESPSMFAADLSSGAVDTGASAQSPPQTESRFLAAERVIREFVDRRENDPVGLVSFAKDAVLRIPPTLDYRSFLDRLQALSPRGLGNGTAIGTGLAVAVLHLRTSLAPRKVIILLTDGENNAGQITPLDAAQLAADLGIRIYTVGIGSAGEAAIRYTDPETGKQFVGVLRGAFDESLLKNIAQTTGGAYFNAATTGGLASILRTIDSMESIQRRVSLQTTTIPHHRVFIVLGLLLVVASFVLRSGILREEP